jgi:hypothetical protein
MNTTSLWQANLAALRAEVFVRVGVRDGSVAHAAVGPA